MRNLDRMSALLALTVFWTFPAQAENKAQSTGQVESIGSGQTAVSPDWGFWAKLAGSSFHNEQTGTVNTFYWSVPNKVIQWESVSSQGISAGQYVLDATGNVFLEGEGQRSALAADPDGTFVFELTPNERVRYSFDGRLLVTTEQRADGQWKIARTAVQRRLVASEVASAKQRAMAIYQAEQAKPAQSEKLSGGSVEWVGGTAALTSPRGFKGRMVQLPSESVVPVTLTSSDHKVGWTGFRKICIPLPGPEWGPLTLTVSGPGRLLVTQSSNCNSTGYNKDETGRIVLRFRSTKSLPYVEVLARTGTSLELALHRVRPDEEAQWIAAHQNEQMAERQSESSSGDSGLLGALAMGVGAALAGGNAEQVMGMAMKGAELTTDNEMSRNVLAGQGDAMVASGTQRMIDQNASNGGGSTNASSTVGVSTAGAGGMAGTNSPGGARKLTMFCFAWGNNNLIQYMSQLGSRNVSIVDQQQWQTNMEQEFASGSGAPSSAVRCHYNDTGETFVTYTQAQTDKATLVPWSPN